MAGRVKAWGAVGDALGGDLVLGRPGSDNFTSEAHYLVVPIAYRGNTAFGTPAGWTKLGEANTGNLDDSVSTAIASIVVFGKRQVATPGPETFTFPRTGGDIARGRVIACDGIDFSSPLDAITLTTLAAAATAVVASGVTTTQVEALLLSFLSGARAGNGGSDPAIGGTPITAHLDGLSTSSGAGLSHDLAYVAKTSAGATGNFTWTHALSARHAVAAIGLKSQLSVAVGPGAVSAGSNVVLPSVRLGSIVLEPSVAARSAIAVPSVLLSSATTSPAAVSARGDRVNPAVGTSSVTVTPSNAMARGFVVSPDVKAELVVAPAPASARGESALESTEIGFGPLFSPEVSITGSWTPEAPLD